MNYTAEQVVDHNLMLTLINFSVGISIILSAKYIHPLKILRIRAVISAIVLAAMPLLPLSNIYALTTVQVLLCFFALGTLPAIPIFFKYFPVNRRFTYSSMLYAMSRAFMYVLTSFGLVYLTKILGYSGIWIIVVPVSIGFLWGVNHFVKLEGLENMKKPTESVVPLAA